MALRLATTLSRARERALARCLFDRRLGIEFTMAPTMLADELDHAISLIISFPDSGIPARAARLEAVRRMILP